MVRNFGYKSGRLMDKFAEVNYVLGQNGCPILCNCMAYLEAHVIPDKILDVGTHRLFVAEITGGGGTNQDAGLNGLGHSQGAAGTNQVALGIGRAE